MEQTRAYKLCCKEIGTEERILWRGQPDKGHFFAGAEPNRLRFGIMAVIAGGVFGAPPLLSRKGIEMALFGLGFMLLGLGMIFRKPIRNLLCRKETCYVITNKRILRCRGEKLDALCAEDLPEYDVTYYRNGNGTITFGSVILSRYRSHGRSYVEVDSDPFLLLNLEDVFGAEKAIAAMDRPQDQSE